MASVSFKHRVEYYALLAAAAVIRRLSRKNALALGRILGRATMKILPNRYRLAKENMTLALPELSEKEIAVNIRKNFEHIGLCGVDMLRFDMFQLGQKETEKYFIYENPHLLQEALALNRGVLLLSAHLGFWEVGGFALAEQGIQFSMVAKPLKNPLTERYFGKLRTSFGAEIINSRKGARKMLQTLRANHVVGILLDQHISPPGSVAVEFFGRKAYTTTAIANMAMKNQIPVVPVFCLRQPDNRYKIWVEPMLLLNGEGEDAVIANTQMLTNIIETAIRRDVSQWFWMHKRWKKRKRFKEQGTRFKEEGSRIKVKP
ncbi:MAG: lysophospholipid acyltransferase family protein [Thermodesulfobacteriota bacterium]|nr:lysophospholipid acyltransferase family protein [Thermodesulfobacteriota bacterium]